MWKPKVYIKLLIESVVLLILVSSVAATDYCKRGFCDKETHIACGPARWGPLCKNPKMYNLTPADKEFIVDLHNKNRHEIASGALVKAGFQPAENMREITWNDELADVACYNARTCNMAHDKCRKTDDHPHAGQNLAMVAQSSGYKPFRDAYESLHGKWFMEHECCHMSQIRQYQGKSTNSKVKIGHFTQMVSDRVDQVGCCVSMYETAKNPGMYFVYIVCNYSFSNILNQPIYVEGKPKCKKFSKKYKSLCVA